tara:strand:- start:49 stop:774 length:726 start_codon:yes stop_codon:yes gene_type:complete
MYVTLGSVQPAYLAWIPFFQRMILSDIFVYLDDVKFSKNSSHNRNKIKSPNGVITLTVPIRYSGNSSFKINKMPIDNKLPWRKKHWKSIELNYSKAPFFNEFGKILWEEVYCQEWEFLGPLNIQILETVRKYLLIPTVCKVSSSFKINLKNNEKLIEICKMLGANKFLVKPETNDYHPKDFFKEKGIALEYFDYTHNLYPQLHKDFIPGLSIIDLVMNCGPEQSRSFLMHPYTNKYSSLPR